MAQDISITTAGNSARVFIDGNEIADVLSYKLEETAKKSTLTLEIFITGKIEVQR